MPVGPTGHGWAVNRGRRGASSTGRRRFTRRLVPFAVPGAALRGPLAIPTQFTAAILVAAGTPRRWTLLWQAVAIVLWGTIATVSAWAALTFLIAV